MLVYKFFFACNHDDMHLAAVTADPIQPGHEKVASPIAAAVLALQNADIHILSTLAVMHVRARLVSACLLCNQWSYTFRNRLSLCRVSTEVCV